MAVQATSIHASSPAGPFPLGHSMPLTHLFTESDDHLLSSLRSCIVDGVVIVEMGGIKG
jgi:hypothetical protein